MIDESEIRPRNPLIVLPWTFGLYLLVYMNQYVYFWLGSIATGASFGAIAGGEVETSWTVFLRGVTGLVLGVPVLLLAVRFLWRRSWDWLRIRFRPGYLAGGAALGTVAAFAAVGALAALGLARIVAWPGRFAPLDLGAVLVGNGCWVLFISMLEETVFRGMATREFALRWGWPAATIGGGLYFAAIHLISVAPVLTPSLVAGILCSGRCSERPVCRSVCQERFVVASDRISRGLEFLALCDPGRDDERTTAELWPVQGGTIGADALDGRRVRRRDVRDLRDSDDSGGRDCPSFSAGWRGAVAAEPFGVIRSCADLRKAVPFASS